MRVPKEPNTFGGYVKSIRKQMHISQASFAELVGVSISHICRLEKGNRLPSGVVIMKLAKALNLPEKELLALAGYIDQPDGSPPIPKAEVRIDPEVVALLAVETYEMQRSVIEILLKIKHIALALRV